MQQARFEEPMLACGDAMRAARAAVIRIGYTVKKITPAHDGNPGTITAHRYSGWAAATPEAEGISSMTVAVHCTDAGAQFDMTASQESLGFSREFNTTLTREIEKLSRQESRRPRTAAQRKEAQEQKGLILAVVAERSRRAVAVFGSDLPAAGITPVHIHITNRSTRHYSLDPSQVRLISTQGSREEPLEITTVTKQVSAGDEGELHTALQQQLLPAQQLAPGDEITGYLYFPAAAYRAARVILTDTESEEPEGFQVEF